MANTSMPSLFASESTWLTTDGNGSPSTHTKVYTFNLMKKHNCGAMFLTLQFMRSDSCLLHVDALLNSFLSFIMRDNRMNIKEVNINMFSL